MDIRYEKENYQFLYRVSVLIVNKEETKCLLFHVVDRKVYMLIGGKVRELETSLEAIKREVKEEIGWDNLEYHFLGLSEEFIIENNQDVQFINTMYKAIYNDEIKEEEFYDLEGDWAIYKWININDLDNYLLHPKEIKQMMINKNEIFHLINKVD